MSMIIKRLVFSEELSGRLTWLIDRNTSLDNAAEWHCRFLTNTTGIILSPGALVLSAQCLNIADLWNYVYQLQPILEQIQLTAFTKVEIISLIFVDFEESFLWLKFFSLILKGKQLESGCVVNEIGRTEVRHFLFRPIPHQLFCWGFLLKRKVKWGGGAFSLYISKTANECSKNGPSKFS